MDEVNKSTDDVLIVDDNPDNLLVLSELLKRDGKKIRIARSGKLAMSSVELSPPSLILLDVNMPEMNGFEVCAQLKSKAETSKIPIIFISALTDTQSKIHSFEVGGVDYIEKPFNTSEVLARVNTHLSLAHLQRKQETENEELEAKIEKRTKELSEKNKQLLALNSTLTETSQLLEENRLKFQKIFESSPVGMAIFDNEENILQFNEKMIELTGYNLPDISKISQWFGFAYPDAAYRTEVVRLWNERLKNYTINENEFVPLETSFLCKNGEYKDLEFRFVAINNINLIIVIDQTQRNKASEQLKESEKKYRNTFEWAPIGIAQTRPEGILHANKQFCEILGYTQDEITHLNFAQITHPDDIELSKIQMSKVNSEPGISSAFEKRYIHKNGNVIWTSATLNSIYNDNGEFQYHIVSIKDITDHKLAEIQLLENKLFIQRITEQSPNIIYVFDIETKKNVFINKNLREILGYKSHEVPEDSTEMIEKLIHPDDVEQFKDYEAQVSIWGEGTVNEFEYRLKDAKGKWRWFFGQEKAFKQVDNTTISIIGVVSEITERKQTELELHKHKNHLADLVRERTDEIAQINEELQQTNEELMSANENLTEQKEIISNALVELQKAQAQLLQSEKMASLGVLVAGVAHEINNPVNFISASIAGFKSNLSFLSELITLYAKLAEGDVENTMIEIRKKEEYIDIKTLFSMFEEAIDIVNMGVERTTKIVKGLRTFARSGENQIEYYDVHQNMENTLVILHSQYKDRIEIVRNFGEIPIIECYPGQINQVFMNLLMNAIQAIENDGTIEIITSPISQSTIYIEIADTGTGIPKEMQSKIFDPFFTTKEVGKGTGLGLSIVYNIISAHGGRIELQSVVGEGSRFKIYLPIKPVAK